MKKLFLIFILCVLSLFSVLFCYADLQSNAVDIMADLPLAVKFESSESLKNLSIYNNQLESILAQQRQSLNTLNYIYYLGAYNGSFGGSSLLQGMKWDYDYEENAPLFKHDIYKGYYSLRTEKVLKQYQSSEFFDYTAFVKNGRLEFDSYIKGVLGDQSRKEQLMTLMQSKLADKLIDPLPDKKSMLDEILSLRQSTNSSKSLDHIYQLFESRVRLQLHQQMVDANKQKLEKLVKSIRITITSSKKGQLLLQSMDAGSVEKPMQLINVLEDEEGFRGLTSLFELFNKDNCKLVFVEETGAINEIRLVEAIDAIAMDENGSVNLNIDKLFDEKKEPIAMETPKNIVPSKTAENYLKATEQLYASKSKAAQAIIKELNRYSIYLELKDKKISNNYTRSFETKQKQWKKDLDAKLNAFGLGGGADFAAYIKQFEILDRKTVKDEKERALIAKFRNSDIQFRKTAEGSLWLTNLLHKLKYMQ